MTLTWRQVRRWRIRRQLLLSPAPGPVEVARVLGGIHAQVTSCSALIAGIRCAGVPDLSRGLVRTWAARGTLHLLPADELDVWVGALTARDARRRFPPSWEREHGVSAAQLHAITDAIGSVLGAVPSTRAELVTAVVAEVGDPAIAEPLSTGWGALLKPAAARGLLCSGPPADDGGVTFVSPAAWLGRPLAPVPAEEAERAVLLRFLAANGPATAVDVGRWWGERPAPAERMIRAAGDAVTAVTIEGEAGYVARTEDVDEMAAVPDGGTDPADAPLLLPGFDPWVIAPLSHRSRAVPDGRVKEVSRTAGWISPVLVVDGLVAGVWEHSGATVTVRPFGPVPRAAVEETAARYAPLLGVDAVAVAWA
ncbi:DNA glycosylase AlkZ-like family protein [Pseudonocardia abyssalis]|uniref:Winged helix DNA-binding domain-containing protein n=1 Tax=Pseudonocardia abyssalis TaxID=2792008 RepID=A0ABS6UN03_9PSEU|nr:crosslink repair DNA glycosylase YcaQ family protein [Pseudonocardia abyssalis]MBW0115234.1 winged helix DNA-binding domain-containing protein [Pseudonocardia abyssalis]MBW0133630.1 winged helix DNA-binding domain-containing protein [Pseudonocardia abyssalis]